MRSEEELELLRRVIGGDEDSFARLIEAYSRPLTRYLCGFLRDDGLAEEVAQTTFIRAYRQLGRLTRLESFRKWLWRIARCAALDANRKRESTVIGCDLPSDGSAAGLVPQVESADYWVELEGVILSIREAMDELAPDARRLVDLRYREDLSYAEIAERMNLGPIQVKARLARIRKRLRGRLEDVSLEWSRLRDELP